MVEVSFGHEVVGFDHAFDVVAVSTDGDTLGESVVDTEGVGALEGLEAKVVVVEVAVVDDGGSEKFSIVLDDLVGLGIDCCTNSD